MELSVKWKTNTHGEREPRPAGPQLKLRISLFWKNADKEFKFFGKPNYEKKKKKKEIQPDLQEIEEKKMASEFCRKRKQVQILSYLRHYFPRNQTGESFERRRGKRKGNVSSFDTGRQWNYEKLAERQTCKVLKPLESNSLPRKKKQSRRRTKIAGLRV